jgi:DNA-binding protein Fis
MSPKEKHIPDDALRTTVGLTAEDRTAIRWIADVRRSKRDKRTTINDILVDSLWYYLEKVEGKNRNQIRDMVPPLPEPVKAKVTQMPKGKR